MLLNRRRTTPGIVAIGTLLLTVLSLTIAHAALDDTDPSQWRSIALTHALEAAALIEDPYRRAESLAAIAKAQALVDGPAAADRSIRQALEAARTIPAAEFQGWVMQDIVLAQIDADDPIGARQTAMAIKAERPQSAALAAIAKVQIRAGNLSAAQTLAEKIRDEATQGDVVREIVAQLSARGEVDAALRLVPTIDDPYYSTIAHGDVAVAQLRKGDIKGANATIAKARRGSRNEIIARIALARAESDLPGALQSLQKIDDVVQRSTAQGRIALQSSDKASARPLLAAAITAIEQSKEKPPRTLLPLAQLGRWQAVLGDPAARDTLQRVRVQAEKISAGRARDELLDFIARGQARAGDIQGALDVARNIDDRVTRALLVRDAVSLQQHATSVSAAASTVGFADPLIDAAAQFGVLSLHPSLDVIDAARAAVQKMQDRDLKPAAFAALAAARVKAGDVDGSRAIFEEALTSVTALPKNEQRASAYLRIVNALDDRLLFLGKPPNADTP